MNWEELRHGREVQIRVRSATDATRGVVGLVEVSGSPNGLWLHPPGQPPVPATVLGDARELRELLEAPTRLTVAEDCGGGATLIVGRTFAGEVTVGEPLRISVPPEIESEIPQRFRGALDRWLEDEFSFQGAYFAWRGRSVVDRPLAASSFELQGRAHVLSVVYEGGKHIVAKRKRMRAPRAEAVIVRGALELLATQDAVSATALEGVEKAAQAGSAWFAVWAQYQKAEVAVLEELRTRLGVLPYRSWGLLEGGRHIEIRLKGVAPDEWAAEEQPFDLAIDDERGKELTVGRCVSVRGDLLKCEADETHPYPESGTVRVSTGGDRKRLERRERALQAMQSGTTRMVDLGEVLDGRGRTASIGARLKAETNPTRRVLRGHSLTEAQRRAVETALNTPDIALIQGPPGTGKTTVIRVITQRLHEEGRSPILLTAYQHQAVLRVIEGVETGGVPAIRIGGARGEDPSEALRPIQTWIEERRAAARLALDQLPTETPWTARRDELRRVTSAWRRAPGGRAGTRILLSDLRTRLGGLCPAALGDRLDQAERALADDPASPVLDDAIRAALLTLVNGQPTTPPAWEDGGPACARKLSRALHQHLDLLRAAGVTPSAQLLEMLDLAGRMKAFAPAPDGFLEQLAIRLLTLAALLAPAPAAAEASDVPSSVEGAVNEVVAWVDDQAARSGPGLADALSRFEQRLVDDPTVIPGVLTRYANAVGSTVSQSVGSKMAEWHTEFDTVIVDEAARANPLDMLVALALGGRIILVGDQNQLPHMLEPRLEKAVNEGRAADASSVLRESLFQRLWGLYASCPPGGIPRTVMLDRQFRMHPVIGQFVSDTFYDGRLYSQTDPTALANTSGFFDGKPIAFVDVPGPRESGRYRRQREAEVLADRVDALLASSTAAGWTVGVIAFYRQQVDLLQQIKEGRGWPSEVSVGTVDAFQGREFDAVFLSCVRSGSEVGFLAMPNRLNVAMSRARRLLVAFGDARTVRLVPAIDAFWDRVSTEGTHDSV